MTAGLIIGGGLGTIAGGVSLLILRSTGMTMEEVRYWQYKWRSHRDDTINDSFKFQTKSTDLHDPLMEDHDLKPEVVAANLDIKALDQNVPEASQRE